MENKETLEVNVNDLLDTAPVSEAMIETDLTDAPTEDVITTSNAKMAAPVGNYTEVGMNDIPADNATAPSSSIVPLCITVIVCLAIGIALGILSAKRSVNKQ